MKKTVSGLLFSGVMLAISVAPAMASIRPSRGPRHAYTVPEIDASAGLLAVAAVLAVMAFVWERNRRASV
jgi:hypothetical protein